MRVARLYLRWTRRSFAWQRWVILLSVAAGSFFWGAAMGRPVRRAPVEMPIPEVIGPGGPSARGAEAALAGAAGLSAAAVLPPAGEFEKQSALVLSSTHLLAHYPQTFVDIVAAVHRNVPVIALVSLDSQVPRARKLLAARGVRKESVLFVVLPFETMWLRDYGPMFVRRADGSVNVADGTYVMANPEKDDRSRDDEVPSRLAEMLGLPLDALPLKLEGGNILTNGQGVGVTSLKLAAANAELGLDPKRIGAILSKQLGLAYGLYVQPLVGEPTGHVDMFMTFLAPNVAVVGRCDPAVDPENAKRLDDTASRLSAVPTPAGPMQVHRIPMPPRSGPFWRSYTNVVFANGVLLVPTFSDVDPALEQEALALYATLLPGWKIVGIRSDDLVPHKGQLHCITVNMPGYVPLPFAAGPPR